MPSLCNTRRMYTTLLAASVAGAQVGLASARPRQGRRFVSTAVAAETDTSLPVSADPFLRSKTEEIIGLTPVVVFSKSWCPFCTKAKEALRQAGVYFQVLELDELDPQTGAKIQEALGEITGAQSVPRVFVGGRCIGGGDETAELAERGELKAHVDAAISKHRQAVSGQNDDFVLQKADADWQKELGQTKFRILRNRGTEPPGSHEYDRFLPETGHFACGACQLPLYSAASKYASNCGWPVFDKIYASDEYSQHVVGQPDGTGALEIVCVRCGSHLGHVFYDDVSKTNLNGERH